MSKEPRPPGRGFCKPRGNLSPLRYELPFLPALPSGASWQIFVIGLGKEGGGLQGFADFLMQCELLAVVEGDRSGFLFVRAQGYDDG